MKKEQSSADHREHPHSEQTKRVSVSMLVFNLYIFYAIHNVHSIGNNFNYLKNISQFFLLVVLFITEYTFIIIVVA